MSFPILVLAILTTSTLCFAKEKREKPPQRLGGPALMKSEASECTCDNGAHIQLDDTFVVTSSGGASGAVGTYKVVALSRDCRGAVGVNPILLLLKSKGIKGWFGGRNLSEWPSYWTPDPCAGGVQFIAKSPLITLGKLSAEDDVADAKPDLESLTPKEQEEEAAELEAELQQEEEAKKTAANRNADWNRLAEQVLKSYAEQTAEPTIPGGFKKGQRVVLARTVVVGFSHAKIRLRVGTAAVVVSAGVRPNSVLVVFAKSRFSVGKFIGSGGTSGLANSGRPVEVEVDSRAIVPRAF